MMGHIYLVQIVYLALIIVNIAHLLNVMNVRIHISIMQVEIYVFHLVIQINFQIQSLIHVTLVILHVKHVQELL
jgi:hypothetical protein